jgi:hypothetical protein
MSKEIAWSKKIPIRYTTDIVVVGGGIAGVIAACAAASRQKQVILIEHFGSLGGQGTIGGVQGFCGSVTGQGKFFDEIQSDLDKFGAIAPYRPPQKGSFLGRRYDCDILGIVLQELVLRHQVTLLLHTQCIDVVKNGAKIDNVIIQGKSGLEGIETQFVIDCTGEADLCVAAGCPTVKGRPSDGIQLPMSLIFFVTSPSIFSRLKPIPQECIAFNNLGYQKQQTRRYLTYIVNNSGSPGCSMHFPWIFIFLFAAQFWRYDQYRSGRHLISQVGFPQPQDFGVH